MGKHSSSSKGTTAAKQKTAEQQGSQLQNPTGEYSEDQAGTNYNDDMSGSDKSSDRGSNFGGGSQR